MTHWSIVICCLMSITVTLANHVLSVSPCLQKLLFLWPYTIPGIACALHVEKMWSASFACLTENMRKFGQTWLFAVCKISGAVTLARFQHITHKLIECGLFRFVSVSEADIGIKCQPGFDIYQPKPLNTLTVMLYKWHDSDHAYSISHVAGKCTLGCCHWMRPRAFSVTLHCFSQLPIFLMLPWIWF